MVVVMSDDDPFADLDEMAGGGGKDVDDSEQSSEPTGKSTSSTTSPLARDPLTDPAFPFDDATQRPIYARQKSWEEFEEVRDFEVKRILRDDGIKKVAGREFHDALLRLAAENPEELAAVVKDARGIDDGN